MASHAHSTPVPSAQTPSALSSLIDALIPLAEEIAANGTDDQRERLIHVVGHAADLATEADVLTGNVRLKARALRLIYAGDDRGFEDGFTSDTLDGGSRAEQLAIQVLVLMGLPQ